MNKDALNMDAHKLNQAYDGSINRNDHIIDRFSIVASMDYLMCDRSIEKITVSTICKHANISRSSFYRLFEDKYDAANWFMSKTNDMGNKLIGYNYNWYDGNLITLSGDIIMVNLYRGAWNATGYNSMFETGIRKRRKSIIDSLVNWQNIEVTDELEFQASNFARLENHIVRDWVNSSPRRSLEELCSYIEHFVPQPLYSTLNNPIDPKPVQKLTVSSMIALLGK